MGGPACGRRQPYTDVRVLSRDAISGQLPGAGKAQMRYVRGSCARHELRSSRAASDATFRRPHNRLWTCELSTVKVLTCRHKRRTCEEFCSAPRALGRAPLAAFSLSDSAWSLLPRAVAQRPWARLTQCLVVVPPSALSRHAGCNGPTAAPPLLPLHAIRAAALQGCAAAGGQSMAGALPADVCMQASRPQQAVL